MTRALPLRVALACLASAPVIVLPAAAPARSVAARAEQADTIVRNALEHGPYPGISVSIEQHGKIIYQRGFGYADIARKIPVTPDTRFPIGSITKSFTCLSVAQLTAAGTIGLDKTAGDYLPDLAALHPRYGDAASRSRPGHQT